MANHPAAAPASGASAASASIETVRLADQLERSLRGGSWHGPALLQAIDGVDGATAVARPIPGAHSILEVVWHVAFWLDAALQRLQGVSSPALGADDDWPRDEAGDPATRWNDTRAFLEDAHRRLHAAVAALPDSRLDDPVPGSDPTVRGLLLGILQHNAYHGGQLALLRRAAAR